MKKNLFILLTLLLALTQGAWATPSVAVNGKLPGAFSVSPTKVVYFSQGNLQATTSDLGEHWTWNFAENQWDFLGQTSPNDYLTGNGTVGKNGSVDLFRWSSSKTYYGINLSTNVMDYVGDFVDWGTNAITNGGNQANIWRTPTKDEWEYLINTRTTTSGARYAVAKVNDKKGLILLPDDWNTSYYALSDINTAEDVACSSNTISSTDWTNILEAHGAVFLPGAGMRVGYSAVGGVGDCYYMSSTSESGYDMGYLEFFEQFCVRVSSYMITNGLSVRLVSDEAPVTPATVTAAPTAISGLIYNGSAQDLINAGIASGGTINYSLDNSTWSTSIPTATDADDYTVYYKVVGDASHTDYTPSPNTVAVTISKADAVITDTPAAVEGLVYTGAALTLIQAGEATGGEMQYSLDNSNWSTNLPTGTDASDYTVYYRVVGDANHTDIDAASLNVTIAAPAAVAVNGKLPNAFSVSATQKVYFSSGNLQYNSDEQKWQFAAHQYDYIGNTTGNTSITVDGKANNTGVADLFGWVGASSIWDTELKSHGLTSSTATNNTNGYGNVANENLKDDWGSLMGTGWRTLTSAEWTYILNTRSGNRYAKANVHGVNGLILLPDGWTQAASGMTGTLSGINSSGGSFSTVSDDNWTILEDEGCVFLPAAGYRGGATVDDAGSHGYYWSSSPSTSYVDYAYGVYFYSSSVYPADYNFRNYGYSVRLVSDEAPVTPATVTAAPTAISGLIYNGSAQDLINAGIASGGTMNYSLDNSTWSTSIPTATDADDYTVYYKVVGDASHTDYTPSPNTVAVTINKADAVITDVPAAVEGLVYTGAPLTLIQAGEAIGGEMQYSLDNSNWSTNLPTGTDASDYTVYYRVVGDANHTDIDAASFNVTIAAPAAVIGDPNTADQITAFLDYYNGQNVAALTIERPVLNNMYNTLCLPFDMNAAQIAASSLNGVEIYELEEVTVANDELFLGLSDAVNAVVAGRPYIVKYSAASQLDDLDFENVTINNADLTAQAVTMNGVTFKGTFTPFVMGIQNGFDTNGGYLFLGQNDQLFWPNTNNPLKPFRAYFYIDLNSGSGNAPLRFGMPARIGRPASTPTGVENVQSDKVQSTKVIENGQLYIKYKGTKYNAQGQKIEN